MAKVHYFQRYSSPENTVTNNTLQLISRIHEFSPTRASRLLSEICNDPIDLGIEISQQERKSDTIPDGVILQRGIKIFIETKVDSPVNIDQLIGHAKGMTGDGQKILLLLTKTEIDEITEKNIKDNISAIEPRGVVFRATTFEKICAVLSSLFQEFETEMFQLIQDFIEYCNDVQLFDQSKTYMRVVPCGDSIEINKRNVLYFQPSDRGYTKHSYVGIYSEKSVHCFFKWESIFDVEYLNGNLNKVLVAGKNTTDFDQAIIRSISEGMEECGYDLSTGHRFFVGRKLFVTNFRKVSYGGVLNSRFINLKDYCDDVSDLDKVAEILRGKTWE